MYALAALTSSARILRAVLPWRAQAASLIAWLASSQLIMSANRCFSAWYDASGRPKV